ncbi:MAG TPA: hypothetical protein VJ991_02800 [Balneolales bacterium]|nr:hypothetical protein [Balneolales bacterium]HYX08632.1 hypothetical protein [Bacteroidales bacterium]
MNSSLITVSILSVLIAMIVANNLMEEFVDSITYIDLGAIFILGLIAGLTAGIVFGRIMSNKQVTG